MKPISRGFDILSKDRWKALTSSVLGGKDTVEARLAEVHGQRDDARAQRDKLRAQRDKLREDVAELKARVAGLEGQRDDARDGKDKLEKEIAGIKLQAAELKKQRDDVRAQRDTLRGEALKLKRDAAELKKQHQTQIEPGPTVTDKAQYATLLKSELTAESARVQALERNLDQVLKRSNEIESQLSRTRAMLAVAIDQGDLDIQAVKTELKMNQIGSTSALSHALLAILPHLPQLGVSTYSAARSKAVDGVTPLSGVDGLSADAPVFAQLIDETPDVVDDLRPSPGSPAETIETLSENPFQTTLQALEEEPDVVDDARPAPGSSAFAEIDVRDVAAAVSGDVVARLPEPAVLKGKLLSPGRAKKVIEERQLQIDGFMADGEYARIQALKDIHKGRRAFIVGNGPSLASQDLSKLDGEITFVANWFANHQGFDEMKPRYYAISSHEMFGGWARQNPVLNGSFVEKLTRHRHKPEMFFSHRFRNALLKETALDGYERRFLVFDRPKFLADEAGGLEFDLAQPMHDGYTVLLTFCIPLAVHMGITEIYMIGCDCDYGIQQNTDARSYFYAPSEHATSSTKAESINRIWAENGPLFRVYDLARKDCDARGVKMFNATAGGKLEILPRVSYDDILSERSMAGRA